ncbi:hypothetical protein BB558_005844, partial [Smittium angustum]
MMKNISKPLFVGIIVAILGVNAGHADFKESLGNGVNQKRMDQYGSKNSDKYMGNAYGENNKYGSNNGNEYGNHVGPVNRPGPMYGPAYVPNPRQELSYNIVPGSQTITETQTQVGMATNTVNLKIRQEPINPISSASIAPTPIDPISTIIAAPTSLLPGFTITSIPTFISVDISP